VDLIHHGRLDQLRLGNRRLDFDERFVGEDWSAFGNGNHIAREF
jgi:hypothetical protein